MLARVVGAILAQRYAGVSSSHVSFSLCTFKYYLGMS
jgi:hypothetical protein